MAQEKKRPWEKRWRRGEQLGKGGQGTSFLAEPVDLSNPAAKYVLKVLNNQTDPERRGRMYREVAALQTLDHPGIPKVVDTNADHYLDEYKDRLGLFLTVDEGRRFWPELEAVITGSELVVTGHHGGIETELLRVPVVGPHEWDKLEASAVASFTEGLLAQCSDL